MPNFSSFLPVVKPGVPFSIINADIPFDPAPFSVLQKKMIRSLFSPLVTQFFVPFTIKLFPFFSAKVFMLLASDPDCGSLRLYAPNFNPDARGFRNLLF